MCVVYCCLQSVDGFAFALSNDGRFLYISETVSIYLGLSQVSHFNTVYFWFVASLFVKLHVCVMAVVAKHRRKTGNYKVQTSARYMIFTFRPTCQKQVTVSTIICGLKT